MKTITEIEENVTLVEADGRRFFLVGTAHVSKASAELVEKIVAEVQPDTICVELCEPRLQSLRSPDAWRETDIFKVIKDGKGYVLMAQIILSAFQKRLAKQFGVRPGEEMRRAIQLSETHGIHLEVVDREIRTTLKRAWSKAGIFGFTKLIASLIDSMFRKDEITEVEIEELKKGDALSAVMSEFSELLPGVKTALIDERDQYMATKIFQAPGRTVVAVLGAGHIPGILSIFGEPAQLTELNALPPKSAAGKIFVWAFPALLVGLLVYGFVQSGGKTTLQMFGVWALSNMVGSALGAAAGLAHPGSVLVAFLSGPFAAIHPVIAVGWLAALCEALLRKPRVKDFESIADDLTSIKGLWKNRVSRIFLILILANLGSMAGSAVGLMLAANMI